MKIDSSSTVDASSKVGKRVNQVLQKAVKRPSGKEPDRLLQLQARIRDLESRGFIKRQKFTAPTTGDFERKMINRKR